jgi:hypothetical protein
MMGKTEIEPARSVWRRLPGPALGLLITVWLLARIEWSSLYQSWRLISPRWWFAGFAVGILSQVLRAVRWRYLLLPVDAIPIRKLVSAFFVGQAATWLLPFRLGEVGGAYALSQMHRVRFSAAMGSVITDRLLDIVWLLGAVLYVLTFLSMGRVVLPQSLFGTTIEISRDLMIHAAQGLGLVLVTVALLLLLFRAGKSLWVRCLHRLLDPISGALAGRIERVYLTFSGSLDALRSGRHLGMIVLITMAYWALGQLGVWLLIGSYPLGIPPSLSLSLLVLVSVAAGLAVPNAPGYVGTLHLAIVIGLLLDSPGIDLNLALGFAVYYHLNAFLPSVLIGLFFVWRDGLTLVPTTPARAGKE